MLQNKIIYAGNIATTAHTEVDKFETDTQVRYAQYSASVKRLMGELLDGYDQYLGIIEAVTYNDKTDRYVIKHQHGTAKCSDDVAQYLLQHAFGKRMKPTVNVQMVKGTVEAVVLHFLEEEGNV